MAYHAYNRRPVVLGWYNRVDNQGDMMTCGSLFSGIGGFELGLLRSGLVHEIKWQVEIDDYATKVLEKNFPTVKRYRDIKDVGKHNLEPVDLICGGFPCQPFSVAGKRKGKEDDRHLWPEMFRCIEEIQPAWVIGENVPGFAAMELDKALSDLESIGYETVTFNIPACAVDAPHIRERLWIVANAKSLRWNTLDKSQQKGCAKLNMESIGTFWGRCTDILATLEWPNNKPSSRFIRNDDELSPGVDRLKCLGNAVVPQVVQAIGTLIKEWINDTQRTTTSS